jgi:tetratricopeptide (TPR) repeat protein
MTANKLNGKIDDLFERSEWDKARKLLENERAKEPDNQWVLTQLGVTFYEQQRYQEALELFLASRRIVPDCPLTLWNLAGALDALGQSAAAVPIYTWLLESKKSPEEDPCWESREWTDLLKADCVYRLGVCFQHLGKNRKAEQCYRQYLDLLLAGVDGSYSVEDVTCKIRGLHGAKRQGGADRELRKAVQSTLQASGSGSRKGRQDAPPEIDVGELLRGRRASPIP